MSMTDRIEKKVLLRATRERVWRAISDAKEFGVWFGVEFGDPFVANTVLTGKIVPTQVDAEIAQAQEPHAGTPFECRIERIEAMSHFSFRWHPYAIDRSADYSKEPTTLVAFDLEEAEGGTLLRITESGFDRVPLERRARAFASNDAGWTAQAGLIAKYLAQRS